MDHETKKTGNQADSGSSAECVFPRDAAAAGQWPSGNRAKTISGSTLFCRWSRFADSTAAWIRNGNNASLRAQIFGARKVETCRPLEQRNGANHPIKTGLGRGDHGSIRLRNAIDCLAWSVLFAVSTIFAVAFSKPIRRSTGDQGLQRDAYRIRWVVRGFENIIALLSRYGSSALYRTERPKRPADRYRRRGSLPWPQPSQFDGNLHQQKRAISHPPETGFLTTARPLAYQPGAPGRSPQILLLVSCLYRPRSPPG